MNTLIAVGTVNTLFLALLVGTKKRKVVPDYVLSLFLLLVSLAFALVFCALEYEWDILLLFLVFGNLLYAPLFYLYVATMVGPDRRFSRRFLWHFLPLILSSGYLLYALDTRTDAEITLLFETFSFGERPALFNMFYMLDLAVVPLYLSLSWRWLGRHEQQIAERYSYRESIDYRWLRRFVVAMTLVWAVIDLPLLGSLFFESLSEELGLTIGFSLTSLLVFYLGYHGLRQATVYVGAADSSPTVTASEEVPRYQRSGLSSEETEAYKTRLLAIMKVDQPYLESSLTIRDLAGSMGLSEHNTSEVINVGFGQTFYELINGYRVEEFKQRAMRSESEGHTLLALALQCGFNSKSSFNRIFRQHTGMTPSAFLKSRHGPTGAAQSGTRSQGA